MKELLSASASKEIVYVNDSRELKGVKGLANKRLCIIKTDFKDINKIKKICKSYPKLEVWLACEQITRKNIITANMCGVKNVIQYPVSEEVIKELLNNSDLSDKNNDDFYNDENLKDLKGLKVMVVDDNHFNTDLLEETLKSLNLDLTVYQKPKEAAKVVNEKKYDLFLLDIMMPELSGYDLAEIIKKTDKNSNTPIIFVSALSDNENKLKSFNLGSYIYIEKPFNIKVIKSQICSLLKEHIVNEKKQKLQDSYIAMVTHDMKGPVYAATSALKFLLNKDYYKEEDREILCDMQNSSTYLQNLVSNVLQKYKNDNGSLSVNKKLNSLKNLITQCCSELKYIALERNISFVVSYKSEIEHLLFDSDELKRVIHNLLTNSIKYSYKNSNIYIDINDDGKNIVVSIKNSGEGVSKDYQERIFDEFVSLSENQKSVSLGLGLHIAKQIISLHGGTIKFESVPKEYTSLTFTLPLK